MSIVSRHFNASPARLSSETWAAIAKLVCGNDEKSLADFTAVTGIGSSLLNDHLLEANAMVVVSKGPRLRIYCLYGEDAISGEDANEESLSWKPTKEEWHAFLPCAADELMEIKKSVKSKSERFSAYDVDVGLPEDARDHLDTSDTGKASIDFDAFRNL